MNFEYKSNHNNNYLQSDQDNNHLQNPVLAKALLLALPTNNNFDSICIFCIASKQTCIIIQNKLMTEASENFNKMHIDLWGPHYPLFLLKKTYAAILLNANTQKS